MFFVFQEAKNDVRQSSSQQTERKEAITRFCQRTNTQEQTSINRSQLKNLIVNDKYKTLFCYVPKVACSNWKRVFLVLDGKFNRTKDISRTVAHEPGRLKFLDSFSDVEINAKLLTYKKVFFVREPLQRLLSAYRNKMEYDFNGKFHQLYGKHIIKKYRESVNFEPSGKDRATFSEFVKYLVDLDPEVKLEVHWERMHRLCFPCSISYDFIGKYESLTSDAAEILDMMGASDVVQFPDIGKAPSGRETTALMEKYFSQITRDEFVKLWQIYADDYELFSYPKPMYLEDITMQ